MDDERVTEIHDFGPAHIPRYDIVTYDEIYGQIAMTRAETLRDARYRAKRQAAIHGAKYDPKVKDLA